MKAQKLQVVKLLIANRGEIAARIIRAAKDEGIKTVALYSDADAGTIHTRLADEKIRLGAGSAKDSYLNMEKVLAAVIQSGADAVHPGYGFFAENARFAAEVTKLGVKFVGPTAETIELMGDKHNARELATRCKVPVVPGTKAGVGVKELVAFGEQVGFPIMIKAVAGGSGRGMRIVENAATVEEMFKQATLEAEGAFGNGSVIAEKQILKPRHIEVQVFGDNHGNAVHFGDRECSVQRRHQKLIEEAPAPRLHPKLREKIRSSAVRLASEVLYSGAGTVEFLVSGGDNESDPFYFLEMNTRIQVEHPVTEEVTGVDLVRLQLRVANGDALPFKQEQIEIRGHAIEYRINAEDVVADFRPATGELVYVSRVSGPGVREDGWVQSGSAVSPFYDSLLSKIIVSGESREQVLERSRRALDEALFEGVPTTLPFHRWLLTNSAFIESAVDVRWIEREYHGEVVHSSTVGPLNLPEAPKFN